MKRYFLFLTLFFSTVSYGQNSDIIRNYIDTYKDLAVSEMQRTGVPASITLAQGIHESGAGLSKLSLSSNNHFGIKCKSNWTGESVRHDDDARGECFRKYPSAEDSYKDHSDFLRTSQRYASLFTLDPLDYEGWARGLKNAGYATNPKYPQVLIRLIEDYRLQDYTLIALGKSPVEETVPGIEPVVTKSLSTPAILSSTTETDRITETPAPKPVYPDGVFKINETRVVYIKKGTSFLAIAKQYDIDLSKIFEFNEISPAEEAVGDQLVFLQRKRKTGAVKYHVVMPGETLYDISQQEGIRLVNLMELNRLKEGMQPAIGEQLSLQSQSVSVPKLAVKENLSVNQVLQNKGTH